MARSELAKQRERINKTVRQAIKRGYVFPHRYDKGKDFSQVFGSSISELSKVKPADIYARLRYFDPVSDKYISGTQRRKAERQVAYQRAQETKRNRERQRKLSEALERDIPVDVVDKTLTEIEAKISNWQTRSEWVRLGKNGKFSDFGNLKVQDKERLRRMLEGIIARDGRDLIALRAEQHSAQINALVDVILYGGSGDKLDSGVESSTNTYMQAELQTLMEILNGGALSQLDSEYLTDLSEMQLPYGENS